MHDYREAILFIMNYIDENEYLIHNSFDSIVREETHKFFVKDFQELVRSILKQAERITEQRLAPDYKEFLCAFYTEALAGILIDWIKNRDKYDREQVIEYLENTIKQSLLGILTHK